MVSIWHKPSVGRMIICYTLLLWPFWFLSRFFNDNYMGVVIALFALGTVMLYDENMQPEPKHRIRWKFWRKG